MKKRKATIMPSFPSCLAMMESGYNLVLVATESRVYVIVRSKDVHNMQSNGWHLPTTNPLTDDPNQPFGRYAVFYHPETETGQQITKETLQQAVQKLETFFKIIFKEVLAVKKIEMANQVAATLQDYRLAIIDWSSFCPFGRSYYVVFGREEEAKKLDSHREEDVVERYAYYKVSGYTIYGKWNEVCLKLKQIFGREIKLLV